MTLPEPLVYLVGAGPGHPGLLTLRGAECLARADLVIFDKLVPPRLLDHAPPSAERICVTDLCPVHQDRIQLGRLLVEAAQQGRRVVRLKGGDPFLFGRGGEETEILHQAGIPFEVVPGVTAALGATACAGIPLTHRAHASAVAFVTGHENPAKPETVLDWAALARFPGTLVIYMGMARLPQIVRALMEHGKPADTPSAVIHRGTTNSQLTVLATLDSLQTAVQGAGMTSPALIVIGPVVLLRGQLSWFEKRPLFGHRVLVTRPRHQASELVQQLEQLGAIPYVLPTVEIKPPLDWGPVDQALAQLSRYQWLVFTSVNGVRAFMERLRHTRRDLRTLGHLKLAAIGPSTADALRDYFLEPDLVPTEYRSESLAAALRERVAGQTILLARADRGREVLRQELAQIAQVDQIAVYSQVDVLEVDGEVLDALRRGEIDFITVTSANVARSLVQMLDEPCRRRLESGAVQLVSISPVTSAALTEMGLPVAAEATEYTTTGVLAALIRLAERSSASLQILEGVPGQIQDDAAGKNAQDVDDDVEAAKRDTDDHVEQKQ